MNQASGREALKTELPGEVPSDDVQGGGTGCHGLSDRGLGFIRGGKIDATTHSKAGRGGGTPRDTPDQTRELFTTQLG